MRVCVVGAGFMGAVVSYHLAQLGADVTTVDSHGAGSGTTGASFAWVNASTPEIQDKKYFDLCAAAVDEYTSLTRNLDHSKWYSASGHLRWAMEGSDAERELVAHAEKLQRWGYSVEIQAASEVNAKIEPSVRFESPTQPVLVFPHESWVNGPAMTAHLLSSAAAMGARPYLGRSVTAIELHGDKVSGVALNNGDFIAVDTVVNAAGPWSDHIASLVGRRLSLLPSPGLVARLRVHQQKISCAMHSPRVEIRPDVAGHVLLHSREIDALLDDTGFAATELVGKLHDLAVPVVPDLESDAIVDFRVGWRPIPRDTYPSIGSVPGVDGYFELVSHLGATLAPLLGRLAAWEIWTGEVNPVLHGYRPDRVGVTSDAGINMPKRRVEKGLES